ncbi:MAG: hypothetical protein QG636_187 [Patescibacteria group bacterium]|jgi:intein/homing endonuclease|nr:hypothetical protein [Patescibacteria group bacterium]
MDVRAKKISETMRAKKLDNFKAWRDEQKRLGYIKSEYKSIEKNGDFAELIGVILGDGHIGKHPRCESLRITGNFSSVGFTERYTAMVERVFSKEPFVTKVKATNAVTITIYEKNISSRLGIPCGSRAHLNYVLPAWIEKSKRYRIRFLRGLYEAEGCVAHHEATYTHKLFFTNRNPVLLEIVFNLVQGLGFHPHRSRYDIQVSRKEEVQNLADLLEFRHYAS